VASVFPFGSERFIRCVKCSGWRPFARRQRRDSP
jgi:hypothetical protein